MKTEDSGHTHSSGGSASLAGSTGAKVQEVLKTETRPVPPIFTQESATDLGTEGIPLAHYLSREIHDLEVTKVWRKTWQMVCREEEIPNSGDHIVYEIVNDSFLIVRTDEGDIKALTNACLHRGRRLRSEGGCVPDFRCPFHGLSWKLDGTFETNPSTWDFPQVDPARFRLPEARVDTWGGWVFINMDKDAPSLEDYLEGLPDHFAHRPLEDRYLAGHIIKEIPANWKIVQEAFLESFHLIATHPQLIGSVADESSQYDVWPDKRHISRTITVSGYASPHITGSDDDAVMANYLMNRQYYGTTLEGRDLVAGDDMKPAAGQTPRQFIAQMLREQLVPLIGEEGAEAATDCELLDPIYYSVFPNFAPWMAAGPSIAYRFRPNGDDHESSIFDVYLLSPIPPGTQRPAPAEKTYLRPDQSWSDAVELGRLAPVLNQDDFNIPEVQRGLKALERFGRGLTLSRYQESRIRHFHKTLVEYLEDDR